MYHTQFSFSGTAEEAIGAVDREGTCRTRSRKWKEELGLRERHTATSRKASWPAHGAGHGRAAHGHATPARRGSWAAVGHGAGPAGQRGPAVARTCPALAPVCSAARAALAPLSSRSIAGPPLSAKAHQLNTTKSLAHLVKDRYRDTGIRSGLRYFQVQSRHFCSDHIPFARHYCWLPQHAGCSTCWCRWHACGALRCGRFAHSLMRSVPYKGSGTGMFLGQLTVQNRLAAPFAPGYAPPQSWQGWQMTPESCQAWGAPPVPQGLGRPCMHRLLHY